MEQCLRKSQKCENVVDKDECASNNGGCQTVCTNTDGSFNCGCSTGYEVHPNGFACIGELTQHYLANIFEATKRAILSATVKQFCYVIDEYTEFNCLLVRIKLYY